MASWFDDMDDRELLDLIPFFERLSKADNVYALLKSGASSHNASGSRQQMGNSNRNSNGSSDIMVQR